MILTLSHFVKLIPSHDKMKKPKDDLATLMNTSLETANQTIKKSPPKKHPAKKISTPQKNYKPEILTRRSTIAFHSADLVRIDTVLDFLRDGTDQRGTLSDGVKIALALCPLDRNKIAKAFSKIQEQDGRRTP